MMMMDPWLRASVEEWRSGMIWTAAAITDQLEEMGHKKAEEARGLARTIVEDESGFNVVIACGLFSTLMDEILRGDSDNG